MVDMKLPQKIKNLFRHRKRTTGDREWLHANVPRRHEYVGWEQWIVAGCLLLALLLAGSLFYYFHFRHNRQFLLRDLSITSGETISEGLVRSVLLDHQAKAFRNGDKPAFLFGPDIEDVRNELLSRAPGIRSVVITRRLPSRMEVRIVEREPVGRIRVKSGEFAVDSEGVVFARNVGVDHLPRIDGLDGIPLEPGHPLDGMGLAAVRLLTAITRPEYALPVQVVDISHTDYLFLTLRDQCAVKLWWRGMDAPVGDSNDALGKRLKRLRQAMVMAPQRHVWDATVPDDNRIFTPY